MEYNWQLFVCRSDATDRPDTHKYAIFRVDLEDSQINTSIFRVDLKHSQINTSIFRVDFKTATYAPVNSGSVLKTTVKHE